VAAGSGRWFKRRTLVGALCAQACLACKGAILFTGIGKSGFIAQKVCQTLVSTGTKAVFLNPTDALHGDIGILGRDDLVVLMSKSGATDELLRLVPYARVRAARAPAPAPGSVPDVDACARVHASGEGAQARGRHARQALAARRWT